MIFLDWNGIRVKELMFDFLLRFGIGKMSERGSIRGGIDGV